MPMVSCTLLPKIKARVKSRRFTLKQAGGPGFDPNAGTGGQQTGAGGADDVQDVPFEEVK